MSLSCTYLENMIVHKQYLNKFHLKKSGETMRKKTFLRINFKMECNVKIVMLHAFNEIKLWIEIFIETGSYEKL